MRCYFKLLGLMRRDNIMQQTKPKQSWLQIIITVCAACIVFGIMQGVHDNYGIMMKALVVSTGVSYDRISFIIGVGAILYGLTQPFFGMLALKKSNAFVIMIGIALMSIGLLVTPLCTNFLTMLLFFGIILPSGTGAVCFGIVMGAITPLIGEKRAVTVSGIVQASAGIGDALMSPGLQTMINWKGIHFGMGSFGILMMTTIPIVLWVGRKNKAITSAEAPAEQADETLMEILKGAFKDPMYRRVFIGFCTCGFNMSIIESHLFNQFVSWGIPETAASLVMTVYGILTMIGAMATGFLIAKFKMKNVLGSVYGIRVLISLFMLLFPKGFVFAIIITGFLGMTGDSTVPPTTGLITKQFGVRKMAIVYGITIVGHQVGAFFSSWLGGYCFITYGNYTLLWVVNAVLCLIASTASFSIKEETI